MLRYTYIACLVISTVLVRCDDWPYSASPCSNKGPYSVKVSSRMVSPFYEMYCGVLPDRAKRANFPALIFINKVKYRLKSSGTLRSFEMSFAVYQRTHLNIPNDINRNEHCSQNPKFLKVNKFHIIFDRLDGRFSSCYHGDWTGSNC